jgi:hypothetical protein
MWFIYYFIGMFVTAFVTGLIIEGADDFEPVFFIWLVFWPFTLALMLLQISVMTGVAVSKKLKNRRIQ